MPTKPVEATVGYQVNAAWFVERSAEARSTLVGFLRSPKEGDGTLLDNSLILAHSDTSFAKILLVT